MYGGHEKTLRQTLIAMISGAELAEHENPGEATVLVVRIGRNRWFNLLWLLPIGFIALLVAVAIATVPDSGAPLA